MTPPMDRDRFGPMAAGYAAFRPGYPAQLFEALARLAPSRRLAWDCATGSGQAALGLAELFDRVVATDASRAQIAKAGPHPRVAYAQAAAEAAPIASGSVDLIAVAQALHWFDLPAFWSEARRCLAPGGVVAAWCYVLARISPEIDEVVRRFYGQTVGGFWSSERLLVEDGYRSLAFPFDEVPMPPFVIEATLTLDHFLGYVGTWSAVLMYRTVTGADPLPELRAELSGLWGAPGARRSVLWPLGLRVGRV